MKFHPPDLGMYGTADVTFGTIFYHEALEVVDSSSLFQGLKANLQFLFYTICS